jgi:glycosyltransferase involved in cell wall biosynthesis
LTSAAHIVTADSAVAGDGDRTAVLCVADEIFLPRINGSAQVYTGVARKYRDSGRVVCSLSFYRDRDAACSNVTLEAYRALFKESMFVPGWNRGGGLLGAAGLAWRELSRWSTGNVFATHPFLVMAQKRFAEALLGLIERNRIGLIYFHKPHTLLLLEPMLPSLRGVRIALDLHDDFVARDGEYAAAYASVFGALPWHSTLRQHPAMYLRHRLTRLDRQRSRRRELSLLQWCDDVFVASELEYEVYAGVPELAGRVQFRPWPYAVESPACRAAGQVRFDAGFIGASNVMNLDAVLYLRDAILPRVQALRPDFRMLLAGTVTRQTASLLHGTHGIEVWDRLDHVADFYSAVAIAAVPIRHGTGVSVKAVEAMAHGCPLVGTSMGFRGLPRALLATHDVTIADDPDAFAAALLERSAVTHHPHTRPRENVRGKPISVRPAFSLQEE